MAVPARKIDVGEVGHQLDELLRDVESGAEVVLLRGDEPVARLVPAQQSATRRPGLHPGAIEIAPDFDESLPNEYWAGGDA